MNWESLGAALLVASLARPVALTVAAWLILRVLRVRHPASRHAVWTAVLVGMMLLPVVSVITPHWKLPVLPRKHGSTAQALAPAPTVFTGLEPIGTTQTTTASKISSGNPAPFEWPAPQTLALSFYFAGLFAMVTYRLVGSMLLCRVISRSTLLRAHRLRESADVLTPVAVGVLHPAVLLPVGWRTWNANTKRVVLAHEFAHLRRHDTAVSALARLAQCVFWFHPLVWWVSRKISDLAELACDAVVLERVDDPAGYSRILLEFAHSASRVGHRVSLPGLAMASGSGMGRRIDAVFELSGRRVPKLSRPGVLLGLIGLPVMCLSATVGLVENKVPSPQLPLIQTNPMLPPLPAPVAARGPVVLKALAQQQKRSETVAQPAPAPRAKFEVASVKPCKEVPAGRNGGGTQSAGTLRINCQTPGDLIRDAYDLYANGRLPRGFISRNSRTVPIEGAPGWINSERYYIDAKADGPLTQEMMRGPLMRTLLEDRFKLKIRRETRQGPVYELIVAQGGPKLEPVENGRCTQIENFDWRKLAPGQNAPLLCNGAMVQNGKLVFLAMSVADFCQNLMWNALDRPVIDKTGIAGKFNFRLEFAPDETTPFFRSGSVDPVAAPSEPVGPSIFTALQQQLGLKLQPGRGPIESIIIDHIERPSEN